MVDQAVAAACGGIVATLVTNPFEMMRIRMQMHRTTYKETVERMIRNEGWLMLTKGIAPRFVSFFPQRIRYLLFQTHHKHVDQLPPRDGL